ncbi:maleylpyruvate isomerase N-terminal domain-containing protein [Nocardioides sp. SR21]|uniref:maleylpyruvate isomerase N-terminal domain-containing protein n=1 Tax=Nocardioides sp. SR21 TaxID=2919501 RepID=UPI001FAA37E5|nr:maleylpyruvate isomerase N-terminal domain-containing protein [Nocardioides sp. SR21]
MTTTWDELYRANVAALTALGGELTDEQLATTVPGTPAWTVHDVFAHLAGGPADAVTERMDGAPGPGWTARHVSERANLPVAELTAEMKANQDAIGASTIDNPRPAIVWDISVHHADLHEALGLGRLPEPLWRKVLDNVAPYKFGDGGVPDGVDEYEAFRALFSRRSREQMQAWGLDLSPDELDELCIFGPREDDQPVP